MKWVKVSERMPVRKAEYFVIIDDYKSVVIFDGENFFSDDNVVTKSVVKWLDVNFDVNFSSPPDVEAFQKAVNEAAEKQGKVNDSFKDISRINSFKEGVFFAQQYFNSHAASLPQSSTEEEKDLWEEVRRIVIKHFASYNYPDQCISELQSTYKISKI